MIQNHTLKKKKKKKSKAAHSSRSLSLYKSLKCFGPASFCTHGDTKTQFKRTTSSTVNCDVHWGNVTQIIPQEKLSIIF